MLNKTLQKENHMRTNVNSLIPGELIHPGEYLLDELEAKEISQKDFAKIIGMQTSQLNEIINGKRAINAETALLFEKALDISAEYWMNVQKNYELDSAKIKRRDHQRLEAIELWNMAQEHIPINFFKKQKVLTGDPLEDIPSIKSIYNIESFDQLAGIYANNNYTRFRKSKTMVVDKVNLIGWVKLLEYKANQQIVRTFNHSDYENILIELKKILTKNKKVKEKIKETLNENGIKIIYQERGEHTPIDGASLWSNGNPAIGMSLRFDRIDNFAFTLFHELGHIFLHLPNNNMAEFIDLEQEPENYKNNKEEKEADKFAQINLIPEELWNDFYNPLYYYSDTKIKDFAKKAKIHPAIVRGRICFTRGNYAGRTKIKYEIN